MNAEILSVGTELLLGHISDTNATYLARQLSTLGIDLYFVSQVGDNLARLTETLTRAHNRSDIVIITGGLGPTEDDLTREAIAAVMEETPTVDPDLEAHLRAFFVARGITMPERNIKQAWVIPSATPLANPRGTAPGWWVERDGKIIVAMPGVPHEMTRMWEREVTPKLERLTGATMFTRILRVTSMGESTVEDKLRDFLSSTNPTIATYAKRDAVDVRITAKAQTKDDARRLVDALEARARDVLGDHVFGVDNETLQSVVLDMLTARGLFLATMESCTGGLVADLITDIPGGSSAFRGGLVSYATDLKTTWGVPQATIDRHGVISVETARAMAEAVRGVCKADVGLGVTGIAGPDTQEDKPVGTVHIAVASSAGVSDRSYQFSGGREEVKWRAALAGLNLLRMHLIRQ